MTRRLAAVIGLLAFAVAILGGLSSGNRTELILTRALWAMAAFSGLGLCLGWVAEHVVREYHDKRAREILGPPESDARPQDRDHENTSSAPPAEPIHD